MDDPLSLFRSSPPTKPTSVADGVGAADTISIPVVVPGNPASGGGKSKPSGGGGTTLFGDDDDADLFGTSSTSRAGILGGQKRENPHLSTGGSSTNIAASATKPLFDASADKPLFESGTSSNSALNHFSGSRGGVTDGNAGKSRGPRSAGTSLGGDLLANTKLISSNIVDKNLTSRNTSNGGSAPAVVNSGGPGVAGSNMDPLFGGGGMKSSGLGNSAGGGSGVGPGSTVTMGPGSKTSFSSLANPLFAPTTAVADSTVVTTSGGQPAKPLFGGSGGTVGVSGGPGHHHANVTGNVTSVSNGPLAGSSRGHRKHFMDDDFLGLDDAALGGGPGGQKKALASLGEDTTALAKPGLGGSDSAGMAPLFPTHVPGMADKTGGGRIICRTVSNDSLPL